MTRTKTLLVLLDWEKAFDKVLHEQLFSALHRMNVPNKIVNVIKAIYHNSTLRVEMEGIQSDWAKQYTGIRRGCTLSPYLFIILMTCLFHDIHERDKTSTADHRVDGMEADEVLYADDTICVSENKEAMNRRLTVTETEGGNYGLRLNKGKCE